MADTKLSALSSLTDVSVSDLLHILDNSASNADKKITVGDLLKALLQYAAIGTVDTAADKLLAIDASESTLGTIVISTLPFAATSHTHAAGDIASGTFADARIAASNVTQHQASINAGQVDSCDVNDSGADTASLWTANKITSYVASQISGISGADDYQADVLNTQTDNTLDPGASPTTGDRYILTNTASLHANFGAITGVGDNDIVEYDGTNFVVAYDVSTKGEGAMAWDRAADHHELERQRLQDKPQLAAGRQVTAEHHDKNDDKTDDRSHDRY